MLIPEVMRSDARNAARAPRGPAEDDFLMGADWGDGGNVMGERAGKESGAGSRGGRVLTTVGGGRGGLATGGRGGLSTCCGPSAAVTAFLIATLAVEVARGLGGGGRWGYVE